MDLTVEYRENVNEYRWAVAMEKVETNPDEKETLATLKVTYKDGETVVGEEELSAMGIDGKDHTFTADALTIPEGYELAADFCRCNGKIRRNFFCRSCSKRQSLIQMFR